MIKRLFDILFSLVGLLFILPVFVIIAVLVKLDSKGPVFFKQIRVGLNGQHFGLLKFRTMFTDASKRGGQITIGRDPRITKIGYFLRKYKLDELPQLLNVLIGEMSFVGPRPEVPYYVGMYNEEQKKVLSVKPGITDYASLKYSNESEILGQSKDPEQTYIREIMPEKLQLNLEYIRNKSLWTDINLILKTIGKVFLRS